jgi:hypothetical protein
MQSRTEVPLAVAASTLRNSRDLGIRLGQLLPEQVSLGRSSIGLGMRDAQAAAADYERAPIVFFGGFLQFRYVFSASAPANGLRQLC